LLALRESYPVDDVRKADRGWIVLQWGSRPPKELREDEHEEEKPPKEGAAKFPPLLVSGGIKG